MQAKSWWKGLPMGACLRSRKRVWVLTGALNTQEPSCSRCHRVGHHTQDCKTKLQTFDSCATCEWSGQTECDHYDILPAWARRQQKLIKEQQRQRKAKCTSEIVQHLSSQWSIKLQVWNPWEVQGGIVTILISLFVSSCLTMFLLYAFLFLFLHVLPYCLYIASCTVRLLMHSPAQICTVMHSLLTNA